MSNAERLATAIGETLTAARRRALAHAYSVPQDERGIAQRQGRRRRPQHGLTQLSPSGSEGLTPMPPILLDERPKSRFTHWHPAVPSTSAAVPPGAEPGPVC